MIEWNDEARLDVTCPISGCGKTSNVRFGDIASGQAKCPHCGATWDGREFKEQVEREFRDAFGS